MPIDLSGISDNLNVNDVVSNPDLYINQLITVEGFLVYFRNEDKLFVISSRDAIDGNRLYVETMKTSNGQKTKAYLRGIREDEIRQIFLQQFDRFSLASIWRSWARVLYEFAIMGSETALEIFYKLGKEDMLADLYDTHETIKSIKPDFLTIDGVGHFAEVIGSGFDKLMANVRLTGYLHNNKLGQYILKLQQVLLRNGELRSIINEGKNSLDFAEIGDYPKLKVRDLYEKFDYFEGKLVRLEGFLVGKKFTKGERPDVAKRLDAEKIFLAPNSFYRTKFYPRTALHINPEELAYFRSLFIPTFTRAVSLAKRVHVVATSVRNANKIELVNIRSVAINNGMISWITK